MGGLCHRQPETSGRGTADICGAGPEEGRQEEITCCDPRRGNSPHPSPRCRRRAGNETAISEQPTACRLLLPRQSSSSSGWRRVFFANCHIGLSLSPGWAKSRAPCFRPTPAFFAFRETQAHSQLAPPYSALRQRFSFCQLETAPPAIRCSIRAIPTNLGRIAAKLRQDYSAHFSALGPLLRGRHPLKLVVPQ